MVITFGKYTPNDISHTGALNIGIVDEAMKARILKTNVPVLYSNKVKMC
jgi:hypothetical protein